MKIRHCLEKLADFREYREKVTSEFWENPPQELIFLTKISSPYLRILGVEVGRNYVVCNTISFTVLHHN
jgi:hypothetical protein